MHLLFNAFASAGMTSCVLGHSTHVPGQLDLCCEVWYWGQLFLV